MRSEVDDEQALSLLGEAAPLRGLPAELDHDLVVTRASQPNRAGRAFSERLRERIAPAADRQLSWQ